jgi:hypothetical protein
VQEFELRENSSDTQYMLEYLGILEIIIMAALTPQRGSGMPYVFEATDPRG